MRGRGKEFLHLDPLSGGKPVGQGDERIIFQIKPFHREYHRECCYSVKSDETEESGFKEVKV
jgi:hypothetical protein